MSTVDQVKFALCQMSIVNNKERNVDHMYECIRKCVEEKKARIVILPEIFNCPYDTKMFKEYAEKIPDGYTCKRLSAIAKEFNIYLVAGSIVEIDENGKYYNCCTVWSPQGEMIGKHRKLHLYDIYDKECPFKESDVFTPGDQFTVVKMDNRKYGIAICNDYRFDELAKIYRQEGVDAIIYTFEINVCQSQYFEPLLKARAADNQVFVLAVSSARDENASYVSYGHSMVVSPWAKILCEASEKEECLICDIDFSGLEKLREDVPLFKQRRTDLYDTIKKK